MTERTYPYQAWVLKPSFKPALVTIERAYKSYSSPNQWDVAEGGKLYSMSELFPTQERAIEVGWQRIHEMEAKLEKTIDSISKKRAALAKAGDPSL